MTIVLAAFAAAAGGLSSVVHAFAGDAPRALFTGIVGALFLGPLWLAHRRPQWSYGVAHLCLAIASLGIAVSPLFAPDSIPVLLGLVAIPVAATVATGWRGGLAWTFVATAVLGSTAAGIEGISAIRTLAWNATIVALLLGLATVWMEHMRVAAREQIRAARAIADREIQGRARTQASLEEREALLATVFRATPAMMMIADMQTFQIVDVNEAFSAATGFSRDRAIGRTLTELGAWPKPGERDRLRDLFSEGVPPIALEHRFRRPDGSTMDVLASFETVTLGEKPHLIVHAVDVSAQKERQDRDLADLRERVERQDEALEESRDRLRHQERLASVGTLAAGIAHQINNPIGAIKAISELSLMEIERDEADAESIEEAFRRVCEESDRCGNIVRGILQFSRDEPMPKWVDDLNPNVERPSRLMAARIAATGGRLRVMLDRSPLPAMISPIAIDQIIVNLIQNAIDGSPGPIEVRVETQRDGDQALIRVTDDGRGIAPDVVERVFDPFFTTRLDEGGTGLGLSVVHGLVEDHDGTVALESKPGRGTTVEIRLPLYDGALAGHANERAKAEAG